MSLTILLFAKARDLAGTSSTTISVPEGISIGDLKEHLIRLFPQLGLLASSLLWAVNNEYVVPDRILSDGETVACFPPVSGG